MDNIYIKLAELKKANTPCVFCVITSTQGSTPRKAGSKMIVLADGSILGTVGGGTIELEVIKEAMGLFKTGEPLYKQYQLVEELHMGCGGNMEVYLEPQLCAQRLVIFGAGHVGRALGKYASTLGFHIVFIDNRPDIYKEFELPGAECIAGDYIKCIEELPFDENTYIVICTPKHLYDEVVLGAVAHKAHTYLGMMGSTRKVAEARKKMVSEKLMTEEELDTVNMPIGTDIKVETPEEIAISIVGKLIDTRNKKRKS
jgi:xanthine dehydrogenase accessory factor